jgi:very-short-patch-repair endonuclease
MRLRARELRNGATDAERHLWRYPKLRKLAGLRFRRQVPIGPYVADFLCPQAKLIVELDGGQHIERIDADEARTRVLANLGYRVLRYWNDDALLRTEDVLDDILRHANSTPPQPSPSLREREGE